MSKCKYHEEEACPCPSDCDEELSALDAQMLASIVILVLMLVGFVVWSLI